MTEPGFTIGIEEEYLLVDKQSRDLVKEAPKALMEKCEAALPTQVSPEFLQCQIEVATGVCKNSQEARKDLAHLRATIAEIAGQHGLAPIAASTHPFANWSQQKFTDHDRYTELANDLQAVGRRMLISGMHVHVAIEDEEIRTDLFNQMPYFLPHFLALSTSSPFWQGRDSGLKSYRLTVFDNLPRTGLPPEFSSSAEYKRAIKAIIDQGIIEDASKIWWDLRPSHNFPTLEMRVCDVPTLLDDTIAIATLYQCTARMLYRLRLNNQRWRIYDRFLLNENRWRAQRYGMDAGLIDFGQRKLVDYDHLLDELIELVEPDAKALGCLDELYNARKIISRKTSADRQRQVYQKALQDGLTSQDALEKVVDSLIGETVKGL